MFKRMFAAGVFVCVVAVGAGAQWLMPPSYNVLSHATPADALADADLREGSVLPLFVHSPGPAWGRDFTVYASVAQAGMYDSPNVLTMYGQDLPPSNGPTSGGCHFGLSAFELVNYQTYIGARAVYNALLAGPSGATAFLYQTNSHDFPYVVGSQHLAITCP